MVSGTHKEKKKNLSSNRRNKKANDKNINISSITTRDCQEKIGRWRIANRRTLEEIKCRTSAQVQIQSRKGRTFVHIYQFKALVKE